VFQADKKLSLQYSLKLSYNYNNPAYAAVFSCKFHSVFERKPTQLPPIAIRVSGGLQTVSFKKSVVTTSSVPTTLAFKFFTLLLTSLYIALTNAALLLKILNIVFMNSVMSSRITIAYLLMALKKLTELLLLWSIETIRSVFDYLIQQASSELNYMPFCLR